MKFSVATGFLVVLFLSRVSGDWEREDEECMTEEGLDRTIIEPLATKDFAPEDNDDFNRYSACYWKKKGTQDDNGEIIWSKVYQILSIRLGHADAIAKVIEACKSKNLRGQTHGQTATMNQNCIMRGFVDSFN